MDGTNLKKLWCESEGVIYVVQEGAHWRELVNTAMNLQVP
jgi:hypothetical protein